MAELNLLVSDIRPNIIGINEVLPKNFSRHIYPEEFSLPGYELLCHPNVTQNKGRGTLLYIENNIKYKQIDISDDELVFEEGIYIEVNLKGKDKLLCACMYRRGDSSDANNEALCKTLYKLTNMGYSHIVIMGDLNYGQIDWKNICSTYNRTSINASNKFIECIRDCFLTQHITEPTRQRGGDNPSTLDVIFTNEENLVSDIDIMAPLGSSDHSVIKFKLLCKRDDVTPQIKTLYQKGNYAEMIKILDSIDWKQEFKKYPNDVEKQWNFFKNIYEEVEKKCVPRKVVYINGTKSKKFSIPLDKNNLRKLKKKNKLWTKIRKNLASEENKLEYNRLRNQIRRLTRKGKKLLEKNIAKDLKKNPKSFWKYAQSKLKSRPGIPDLEMDDKSKVPVYSRNDRDKANAFLKQFSSVFTTEPDSNDMPPFPERDYSSILDHIDITTDVVIKKFKKLKINKSPGPDGIHPRVLHEVAESIAPAIAEIFRTSLNTKTLPMEWKHAKISAIYKKGTKSKPLNYRPVSLTSIVCKTLESIVRDHVITHMKENGLFSDKQFGFIGGRSTTLQLLHVMNIWTDILDMGGSLDVVYCDFMKAFDKVPHKRLVYKVSKYGIKGNILGWIKSFLTDRTQYVKVGEEISETAPVTSGIPQGSVLGPLLFVIYINDMPEVVSKDSYVYLFADDTKIFRATETLSDKKQLQSDIDNLYKWSNDWLLKFHPDKCLAMKLGSNNIDLTYTMGDHKLGESACEKDLGVHIDSKLTFDSHINSAVNKANKILAITKRTFEYMDPEIFCLIFKSMVRPHLEYAAPIWSPHTMKQKEIIENVQRRATKLVPGLKDLTYPERLKILKLPSLAYRRARGDMIQVFKLTTHPGGYDPTLPKLFTTNTSNLRGHSKKLFVHRPLRDIKKFSFTHRITKIWNALPENVINCKDVKCFEFALDKHWKDQELRYNDYKSEICI